MYAPESDASHKIAVVFLTIRSAHGFHPECLHLVRLRPKALLLPTEVTGIVRHAQ